MKLEDADSELLKTWTIKRLEHVSDADSDVLADYVIALVSTSESSGENEARAKANCIDNLKDFLGDHAEPFIHELFSAIATKSYDPTRPQRPRPPLKPARPTYQPPRRTGVDPGLNPSKKRSYHDWDRDEFQPHNDNENGINDSRPLKAPRRGGGGPRAWARGGSGGFYQSGNQRIAPPPTPPPGMPAWDPDNPLASLMAMSAAMGLLPPGFELPSLPATFQSLSSSPPAAAAQLCRDYHNRGFCTRGANCSYDHGLNPYVVPPEDEYDPANSGLFNDIQGNGAASSSYRGKKTSQRGRSYSRGGAGGGNREPQRSEFSHRGPNYDRSITQLVVEQIPEDKFDEKSVREFFCQFGAIEHVELRKYKRAAIITYGDYDSANAAYTSPKVVFDNRFVKVYWYHPHGLQLGNVENGEDGQDPEIDLEEVARRQEDAQRRHEQRQKDIEDARRHKEAFDAQLKKLQAEKRQVSQELARRQGKPVEEAADEIESAPENERTRGLREQLAKLEEEAKALGIDPNAATYYPRGRGGYRRRGRGRSGWAGAFARGGAVKRLDNRPKTLCLTFAEGTYQDHEEALRSWLLFNSTGSASLTKHPTRDAALIEFPERYLGEVFMDSVAGPDLPLTGKLQQLAWYKGEPGMDTKMDEVPTESTEERRESSYDVADVDQDPSDRWG